MDLLKDAIKRLQAIPGGPKKTHALSSAYLNLSLLEIAAGECLAGLADARTASQLIEEAVASAAPVFAAAALQNTTAAKIAEGLALRCAGDTERGSAIISGIVDNTIADLRDGKVSSIRLVGILNESGGEMWEMAQAALADRPDLLRKLEMQRIRPREEIHTTVKTLADLLASADRTEVAEIRAVCRSHRSFDSTLFDAAWQEVNGELPAWLQIDLANVATILMWCFAGTRANARNHMESHPVLLEPSTEIILEELHLAGVEGDVVNLLQKILADARAFGVTAVYAPWIAQEEVEEWADSEDSLTYLEEHPDLQSPEIASYVSNQIAQHDGFRVLEAVLVLAQRGELHIARKIDDDPALGFDYLRAAWRSTDATRLGALASVVWAASESGSTISRQALAVMAVAKILDRNQAEAKHLIALAADSVTAEQREEIFSIIGDAIAHHPAFGAPLAGLFRLLPDTDNASVAQT
jgi:hypothetical protein